jgi:pilus assembly protein CpaB
MNNRNSLFALAAGILFGGLAFLFLYQKASEIEQKTTPIEILVASHYISPDSLLKADMVEKKAVPESFVSPSAIHDVREVEGLISLVPISASEQILSNKFGASEESLAFVLNPGYRAYTIEVNETSGVGNLIRPGNHVDIITKTESNKKDVTSFVFQNVQVLAVGQKLDWRKQLKTNQSANSSQGSDLNNGYSTVTLAVTPEQSEILMFLEGHPLRLVLRAPNDDEIISIPPQSESEVMSKLGHFVPKTHEKSIEIIHGNSKQGD